MYHSLNVDRFFKGFYLGLYAKQEAFGGGAGREPWPYISQRQGSAPSLPRASIRLQVMVQTGTEGSLL